MNNNRMILKGNLAMAEMFALALDEIDCFVERCQYARTEPRDMRLAGFYDNELVEEIERRGYPVGRKDIMASILIREAKRRE